MLRRLKFNCLLTRNLISFLVSIYLIVGEKVEIVNSNSISSKLINSAAAEASVLSLAHPISISSEESENFSPEFQVPVIPVRSAVLPALSTKLNAQEIEKDEQSFEYSRNVNQSFLEGRSFNNLQICPKNVPSFEPHFDASEVFQTLGFHDSWIRNKWFWGSQDFDFEGRFVSKFESVSPPPSIKVFVVPHSHSDPGWLKTFEGYFYSQTKHTLDYAVDKLTLYPNMTFIWNEISFLSKWWEHAREEQKCRFKELIAEGRLEILTGGWVMQDEATVNLYTMIDQLVEGRQWVKSKLGIVPNISWSIDPFGHGSTFPYILKTANINYMVIQRLHYAWKKYLAENQFGNFEWVQRWDKNKEHSITCHNAPFDLYTTKHTCGPDPLVCLKFDFRNIQGEYSEYMRHARPVRESNLGELAASLVKQFQKTASLQPHNIVMFPLGDDFRFDKEQEWDQQYENYVPLMNYINSNWDTFRTEIRFGTVSDYFQSIERENVHLPTFTGDFFPYSDVYVSGRPAYWTGFYSTRPYWKKFYRETENNLRGAEILFTYATNLARQSGDNVANVILGKEHTNLVKARRNLALFAHHDGATGTSKRITMDDYGRKLLDASKSALQIQRQAVRSIFQNALNVTVSALGLDSQISNFGDPPTKIARVIYETATVVKKMILFNSLAWRRDHLVKVLVTSPIVKVFGPNRVPILSQVNPVVEFTEDGMMTFKNVYELTFLADLQPLALSVFEIQKSTERDPLTAIKATVTCKSCLPGPGYFELENLQTPTIVIGNGQLDLLFDGETGLLNRITKLREDISLNVRLGYGAYKSVFRDSGAYLLKPDTASHINIPFDDSEPKVLVVEGPVVSYISVYQAPMKITTRILKSRNSDINSAIFVENVLDLGNVAAEVYMRLDSGLNSNTTSAFGVPQPTFYTDQNGFTIEKRVKVPWIGYEGNNYPVNTMAYIQQVGTSQSLRLSMLVDRAHGFSSMESGRLETLIERRTIYDDGRGMSEGVLDNKRTQSNYILILEKLPTNFHQRPTISSDYSSNLVTLTAHHLSLGLNYPPSHFNYDDAKGGYLGKYSLLTTDFPLDSHLINLRTISNITLPLEEELPSSEALMIVQKLGYLEASYCSTDGEGNYYNNRTTDGGKRDVFLQETSFNGIRIDRVDVTDLAGVEDLNIPATESSGSGSWGGQIYNQYSRRVILFPLIQRDPFEITSLRVQFSQPQPQRSYQSQFIGK